jgi:recombination DNA repair RAD52 pathway protein
MTEQQIEPAFADLGPQGLSDDQREVLLRPIARSRVAIMDGQSHLEAWDVRAHLIRVFGFGEWSADLVDISLIHDLETTTRAGKEARKVAYRATVRLILHATGASYTEAAVGESVMPTFKHGDAHDMAIKTAESQALKRCAINLGTQFGLSLYNNGSLDDVVRALVAHPTIKAKPRTQVPSTPVTPAIDPARAIESDNPYE